MPVQKVTREEIIKRSMEIFHKQGFHQTSMSDLAKACGLLKGSFYYHFKSKDELMLAVLETVHSYYQRKVFSIAYDDTLVPKERFVQLFEKQEPLLTENLAGCLFGNLTLETISTKVAFKTSLQAFFSDFINALTAVFACSHDAKIAQELAVQSVMEIEGALLMMRLYDDKQLLNNCFERILSRL